MFAQKKTLIFFLYLISFTSFLYACSINIKNEFNTLSIKIDGKNNVLLNAMLADTQNLREIGLMRVSSMPQNKGMLFIFDNEDKHCFWMKDTYIPLSIAFIDKNKNIIDIQHMKPNTENVHCSIKNVKYALEVNYNWFERNDIKINTRLIF